ncbi:MAG: PepSY domain-containing protein [Rhodoferax sp.]|uniref:PepSY domain-containing protein n=1 Tax=Rhodoferax sp. TaxID=50421 RepID=UPI0032678A0B
MKHPLLLRCGLLALAMGLVTLSARADDDCDAPMSHWQSREAVRQMATRQGWQIQRLKIDDGCYELRGTDAQGRAFKAKIDPETLKVLKIKKKDHQPDRERENERDPTAPRGRTE